VLPGRTNVVLTRRPDFVAKPGVVVRQDLDAALNEFEAEHDGDTFVIGGVELFRQALPRADRVYETVVHAHFDGDTFLPPIDFSGWRAEVLERHPVDERHAYAYTATRYDRVR
jgi:dihydrofolate reductase